MKWMLVAVLVLLGAIGIELKNLESKLDKLGSADSAAAAAVEKFEKDFFAKLSADEKARLAAIAEQDAARRKNIDAGLSALPSGNFRSPVYWNDKPSQEPPKH
jgi:hypothetical protein